MNDFDDFLSGAGSSSSSSRRPAGGQPPREGLASHQPLSNLDQDPFASFESLGYAGAGSSSQQGGGRAGQPSHTFLDADDVDLMGDEMGSYTRSSSRGGRPSIATSGSSTLAPYQQSGPVLASMDSGLPFAGDGVTPAGHTGRSPFDDSYAAAGGISMSGNFKSIEADDELTPSEEFHQKTYGYGGRGIPENGSARGGGGSGQNRGYDPRSSSKGIPAAMSKRRGKGERFEGMKRTMRTMNDDFRRAWGKQPSNKVQEGERVVQLNDTVANELQKFSDNYVSTGKYNFVTFVPKFLVGESSASS